MPYRTSQSGLWLAVGVLTATTAVAAFAQESNRATMSKPVSKTESRKWSAQDEAVHRLQRSEYWFLRRAGYSDREIGAIAYMAYRSGQPTTTVARLWSVSNPGDMERTAMDLGTHPREVREAMDRAEKSGFPQAKWPDSTGAIWENR